MTRNSVLVGIHLEEGLRRPGSLEDVIMEDGDLIVVPRLDPTVFVQGAVAFESPVLYRDGQGLKDYLSQAGGAAENADMDRISVLYPSGRRATARKTLFFNSYPDVQPGSTIFVPLAVEEEGFDWGGFIQGTLSVTSALMTVLLVADRIGS